MQRRKKKKNVKVKENEEGKLVKKSPKSKQIRKCNKQRNIDQD